jgi:hypothetical protein
MGAVDEVNNLTFGTGGRRRLRKFSGDAPLNTGGAQYNIDTI